MASQNSQLPSNETKTDGSKVNVTYTRFSHSWTISQEEFEDDFVNRDLKSNSFSPNAETTWRLRLYYDKNPKVTKHEVRLFLCLCASSKPDVEAQFRYTRTIGHDKVLRSSYSPWYSYETVGYNARQTIPHDGLFTFIHENDMYYQRDGHIQYRMKFPLTIVCDVIIRSFEAVGDRLEKDEANVIESNIEGDSQEDLSLKLFESRVYGDVLFDVQGREIRANKGILARSSAVFWAVIEHEIEERGHTENPLRLTVTGTDYETFEEMLRFVYTGMVRNIDQMADKLLAAATEYRITRLRVMCEKVLRSRLSTENVAGTLILAHLHDVLDLKAQALKFTAENLKLVLETEDFKLIITSHPALVAEILHASVVKQNR